MIFLAPVPLAGQHDTEDFSCGTESLDSWLKRRALKNQIQGASRTYVVCVENRVVACYALASGAILDSEATGRLAVDSTLRGKGFGRALVRDAAMRVLQAADAIGIRGMTVQALSDEAQVFYEHLGFEPSHIDPRLLMITLADLQDY